MRIQAAAILASGLCLSACSSASSGCPSLPTTSTTTSAAAFSKIAFDYIIIGKGHRGGTAGLTVATRLSEEANTVVGVVEAGFLLEGDPLVDVPGYSGAAIGNSKYDWMFVTTPQPGANGRVIATPRGKMLGGSSGLNLLAWGRASKLEYDAWEVFGGSNWTFDALLPYFKKSETVAQVPTDPLPGITPQAAQEAQANRPRVEGFAGPVQASYTSFTSDIIPPFVETLNSMGIPTNALPDGGNITGVYDVHLAIDAKSGTRSYSANAYYCPVSSRKNLHVITGARATRVLFSNQPSSSGSVTATGVVISVDNQNFTATVRKEVVLSAGTVQTPQLLELSGIGNATLLKQLGIKSLVDLPGVGENFQEHLYVPSAFALNPGHLTYDALSNNATFSQEQTALYNSTGTGLLATTDSTLVYLPLQMFLNDSKIYTILAALDREANSSNLSPLQQLQYSIQSTWIKEGVVPQTETIDFARGLITPQPNTSYMSLFTGIQHPFSRGSVHINTTDPLAAPVIDPRYLSRDIDMQILLEVTKFGMRTTKSQPLAKDIQSPFVPSANITSDEEITAYARTTVGPGDHCIGTAAMAPRQLGGVVDPTLKVYGTTNLRIADASIIPLHVATHLQATVYAIGEKAADLIQPGS